MSDDPINHAELVNQNLSGFNRLMGLRFTLANGDEAVADVPVRPELLQPYGLVHGGVYCAIAETLCSTGAALWALPMNRTTVGVDNSTSFLKAVRSGTLTGRATPIQRGRRTQLWQAEIRNDEGELVAAGRVRLLCLEQGAALAGQTVELKPGG